MVLTQPGSESMGMFDDLIPSKTTGGMFDDLIPSTAGASRVDFDRPIADVRADIAKIPEGAQRDAAMKSWADAYVAKERKSGNAQDLGRLAINPQRVGDFVRNVAKGTIVGSFADELNAGTSAALHAITGGAAGAPYDESVAYQRATDRALQKEAPVQSAVEQIGGAFASGAPIAKAVMGPAKTVLGQAIRGAGVGGTAGYVAGFGEGEGDAQARHDYATSGEGKLLGMPPALMGLLAGATIPPAISGFSALGRKAAEVASPTAARVAANVRELPRRLGISASADGAIPETAGGRAAAEQIIANQLSRAGISADQIRAELDKLGDATRFHTSGRAQDATALVDLDPSLQRLAGSVARSSPEGGNVAKTFIEARQTGVTPPAASAAGIAETSGLPTRPMLAKPLTAEQSKRVLGTDFRAGSGNVVPMGQGERVQDALKRAFRLEDAKWHGHGGNALRTDQELLRLAKEEAQALYGATYQAGRGVDLRPVLQDTLRGWADRLKSEPQPVAREIQRVMRLFFTRDGELVSDIERFDKAKQFADGVIEKFFESPIGRNRYVGGVLNELKNDLLKAVDGITTKELGSKYATARGAFGSRMEARDALQMGRDAFKQDSDIGVDAFRSLTSDGQQKLFRLGLLSGYEKAAAHMKRGADKTQIFDNPRIQELLAEVIPRSRSGSAEFADRPERFGAFVGAEKRMIDTRNVVQGNSATAQRLRDDEAFGVMTKLSETVERFKSSASVTMLGVRAVEQMLDKMFGMRADTAASIARMLFTANPQQRLQVLAGIERRLGRNRFEQFTRLLEEYQRTVAVAGARQGAMPETTE